MDEKKKWQIDLNEYIRQGEPEQVEKSEAWQIAIGLQQVDGLTTSDYLLNTAKDHIEGKIDIKEAQKRIHSYYEEQSERKEVEKDTEEKRRFSFPPRNIRPYIGDCLTAYFLMQVSSELIILQKKNGC